MLENPLPSTFAPHLQTQFRIRHGPAVVVLELCELTDASNPRQIQFSLVFRGPQEPLLPQQIYMLEHDQLGTFDLFIVPIGRDADGLYYQAIFNRLTQPSR